MRIYIFMFFFLIFLELICSSMLIIKVKKIENFSLFLLFSNLFVHIISIFTRNTIRITFLYNIIYNSIKFDIFYLVINIMLILGYFGIDDNLKSLHRFCVSVFYLVNVIGILLVMFN